MLHDGDGFVQCGLGHRHWGKYGAAGLLLHHDGSVLLQHRSETSIGGNTWGLFGGARDSDEDAVTAALRETAEESTLDTGLVRIRGVLGEDHGGWGYDTVVADVDDRPAVGPRSWETAGARWVPVAEVTDMDLFPPFARSWPRSREAIRRTVLVVDTANVMGSRNDGWWRDRHGAAIRLRDQIDGLRGVPLPPFDTAYPDLVMIVEGKAKGIGDSANVAVFDAPDDGDDAIVAAATERVAPGVDVHVVTADRELRRRCESAGAAVLGPKWLLNQL
jgi:8-oxo-dGTP pyrophosphatase MutT (NUDIX family)